MANDEAVSPIPSADGLGEVYGRLGTFPVNKTAFTLFAPLARLAKHIEEHPEDPLGLILAADVAHLQHEYFSRYFKKMTGVCFEDWRGWWRVSRAVQLLSEKNASIADISTSCGFGSLRSFQRHCRIWTGMTPQAIRNGIARGGPRHSL